MAKGKTASELNLSQRRERAFSLFLRGWNNADVARDIKVTPDTVTRYRAEYEGQIREQAQANPRLLTNIVENTVRALAELEEVRKAAWEEHQRPRSGPQTRMQALNTLARVNDQRAKLFGLFGVKQEYFLHVQNIQRMQEKLINWMRMSLCAEDRRKLEAFMLAELSEYLGTPAPLDLPALSEGA